MEKANDIHEDIFLIQHFWSYEVDIFIKKLYIIGKYFVDLVLLRSVFSLYFARMGGSKPQKPLSAFRRAWANGVLL